MSNEGKSILEIKEELMADEEFRIEYEKLKPRYAIISKMIGERKEQN